MPRSGPPRDHDPHSLFNTLADPSLRRPAPPHERAPGERQTATDRRVLRVLGLLVLIPIAAAVILWGGLWLIALGCEASLSSCT